MFTSVKTCFKCLESKPLTEFYKHSEMGDGHLNKCKCCTKKDTKQNRAANHEHYLEYDRERAKRPERVAKSMLIQAAWRLRFPERRSAQNVLAHAVKAGKVIPEPCFICGAKAEAHHPDYSQPLDVVWLCPLHHKQAHALVKNAA